MLYQPRVDAELQERLAASGAVVIEGAKACGKTATATRVTASHVMLDVDVEARQALAVDPSLVLDGERPRLLDEWQVEPSLWNHVRRAVDEAGIPGQFVLTRSAVAPDDAGRHSGAGRFSFLRMRPMTLFESGISSSAVSLAGLFGGEPVRAADPGLDLRCLIERIVIGDWPAQQDQPVADAARAARDYLDQIRQVDISQVGATRRDPARVGSLLTSLGRNVATEVKNSVLAADAGGSDGALDEHTVAGYLDGQVLHYRDNYGIEVDAVVQLADGRWGAFEVKLGASMIDEGAKSLLRFVEQLDLDRVGRPTVLAVICATGYGYVRDDGVAVIPIGALCP